VGVAFSRSRHRQQHPPALRGGAKGIRWRCSSTDVRPLTVKFDPPKRLARVGVESFLGGQKDRVTLSDFGPYRTALIQRLETSLRVPRLRRLLQRFPFDTCTGRYEGDPPKWFIRLYQTLDNAGRPVKLDICEGMPHNFALRISRGAGIEIGKEEDRRLRAFLSGSRTVRWRMSRQVCWCVFFNAEYPEY
jgi:hypothetical protein